MTDDGRTSVEATAGPWTVGEPWDTPNGGFTVYGANLEYVADVYAGHHPDDLAGPVEGAANARLIAAAPAMRDALERIRSACYNAVMDTPLGGNEPMHALAGLCYQHADAALASIGEAQHGNQ